MPITAEFVAEALARVPGRRLRRVDPEALGRIANLLQSSRCVPLPGAYAARLRTIRDACPRFGSEPSPARRAAVAIGLLGRTDAAGHHGDHWNLRQWRPVVHHWYTTFAEALPAVAVAERTLAMLAALYVLALAATPAADAAGRLRDDLCGAIDRLEDSHRAETPLAMPPGFDPAACGSDAQWQTAAQALRDGRRCLVKALYFMHAFHAALDCRQPELDRLNKTAFEHLYAAALQRLRAEAGTACGLQAAAAQVATGLPLLGAFSSVAPSPVAPLAEGLPSSFRAFSPRFAPTPWRYVRELLVDAGATEALRDEQALAEASADRVIDVLRIERRPSPQTGQDPTYGYLEGCSRPKYGHCVHWSLFNRLKHGRLDTQAKDLLGPPSHAATGCSLCGSRGTA